MKCMKAQVILWALIVLASSQNSLAQIPFPPEQPLSGPGGYAYEHIGVTVNGPYWAEGYSGNDNYRYFLYEPAIPTPVEAPAILFLHGWGALWPGIYEELIGHIVKKGYVVVWAQYQRSLITLPFLVARNAIITWKDALKRLKNEPSHVRPETDKRGRAKTAIVGHSAGGYLGAVIAAKSVKRWKKIPKPYAVVALEPGGYGIPDADFEEIDPDTKVIIVVGDEDDIVCKFTAVSLWNEISQIPDINKDFLLVQSDYHGIPEQIADHYFPLTFINMETASLNALDFFVTYKLSVGALNCAFLGEDCEYALGNGSFEQIYMGKWSDGMLVRPMVWIENPNSLETTCKDP